MQKVIVVGAGIGGMITAGILAKRGISVTIFERANIAGGRSHVFTKDDFVMSYGAHALITPNDALMKSIFTELNIKLDGNKPDNKQFFLLAKDQLVPGLLGPGLFTSKAIAGLSNRIVFLLKFLKLIRSKPVFDPGLTVGQWIERNVHNTDVAIALRAYAALSTYDGSVDKYPMNAFVEHARRMYSSTMPLLYVNFDSLLKAFERAVVENGGDIQYGQAVTELIIQDGRISGVVVDKQIYEADAVVLNVPPTRLEELSPEPTFQAEIGPVLSQPGTYAFVYDVALDKRIGSEMKNVLDPEKLIYINDMSLNCPSTTPKGMQMLNCLKLLTEAEEMERDFKQAEADVEHVLDSLYPAWRQHIRHRRVINRAMVQGISTRVGAHKLPVSSKIDDLFYVGDSTDRPGAFSIPAYDSAVCVADVITSRAFGSEAYSWKIRQKAN